MPIQKYSPYGENLGAIKRLRLGLVSALSEQDFQTKTTQNVTFKAGQGYLYDMKYKDFKLGDLLISNEQGIATKVGFNVSIINDLLSTTFDAVYRQLEGRLLVAEVTTMNGNIATYTNMLMSYEYKQGGEVSESPMYDFSFERVAAINYKDYTFPKLYAKIIASIASEESPTNVFRALITGINTFTAGQYEVGYSLVNDISTVTDWFTTVQSGKLIIPTVPNNTLLYVFVRLVANTDNIDMMPHSVAVLQYRIVSTMVSLDDQKPDAGDMIEFDGSNTVIN